MEFRYPMPVRFNDIDRAGIVYYPNFLHYYHVAFEEFFAAAHGTAYPEWIETRRVGFPTVHADATFSHPIRYGDPLIIEVSVKEIGNTSVKFGYRAVVEGRMVGSADITTVCVGLDDMRPKPIPEDLIPVFEQYRSSR